MPRRLVPWLVVAGLLVVQVWVLYAPHAPGKPMFPGDDKVVHALMFAAPAFVAARFRLGRPWLLVVLALHAPVSEIVQHAALPGRSGDPFDAAADLLGVALGVLLGRGVVGRARSRW